MNSRVAIVLLLSATMICAQWSEWAATANAPCSEDCGMYGVKVTHQRTCPTPGACPGDAEKKEKCGSKLCLFPKRTCTKGYIKGLVANKLQCVQKEESTTEMPTTP
ncbi:hypothetical protein PRIPAC_70614 [Pristionchus pacificus]|uniref:Uncharacterized protein n=1 Tax=Pristionchus pacificus TaxID=54126 RepID=A0A2A6C5T3_PRIPA|nr:hypothetical protein PRIPAC_70614 [Pristionchus pacificus]|eukprot:PDM73545.1 hypothetical protein PRIPAC_40901 [Pristionchus pacificus]